MGALHLQKNNNQGNNNNKNGGPIKATFSYFHLATFLCYKQDQ